MSSTRFSANVLELDSTKTQIMKFHEQPKPFSQNSDLVSIKIANWLLIWTDIDSDIEPLCKRLSKVCFQTIILKVININTRLCGARHD